MSGRGLLLVLAAAGVAGVVILLAPPQAVGEEAGGGASGESVEGTVLVETGMAVQQVPDRLVVGFEEFDKLAEFGIESIWCHPEEKWAINSLTVRPGHVLMCEGHPRTAERLEHRGVKVVPVPYDEIQKNGGGIHCSAMELRRDPA